MPLCIRLRRILWHNKTWKLQRFDRNWNMEGEIPNCRLNALLKVNRSGKLHVSAIEESD